MHRYVYQNIDNKAIITIIQNNIHIVSKIMIKSIGVHIKASDFKKSTAFYESLGFQKIFEYGPDKKVKEKYNGVTYGIGECRLELADGHVAVKPPVFKEKIASSKISLMINVESIASIIRRCETHNIPLAVGPRHYYWGTLEIVVKDPDGVVLVFICPYSKAEAEKVNADEKFAKNPFNQP